MIENNISKQLFLKIAWRGYDSEQTYKIVNNIQSFINSGMNNPDKYYKQITGKEISHPNNCTY
jgi:hypothetical protein